MNRRRGVQLFFFVAALGALFWLLGKIGWAHVGQAVLRVGLGGAVILAALGLCETALDSLGLAVAIGQPRAWRVLLINSLGALLNQILPFDLGEVAKGGLLHRTFPGRATIAGTIVWNYVFKISRPIVTLVAAVLGLLGSTQVRPAVVHAILAGAVLSFVPYLLLRLLMRRGAAVLTARLLGALRILGRRRERFLEAAREVDETALGFWHRRRSAFLGILVLQVGARVASWLSLFATLRLIDFPVTFTEGALIYAAMNTAELVITIIPARLGVAEGAAFGIFALCGLPAGSGVIMYVILRLKSLATTGALAPFALLRSTPEPASPPSAHS
jgi:hypothetical protein